MQLKRKIMAALAGIALGAGSVLAVASPAQAAWDNCPSGVSCYYSQASGGGTNWWGPGCGWYNLPFKVVSLWNRGTGTIYFYRGSTYSGWSSSVGYKGSNGDLAATRIYIDC